MSTVHNTHCLNCGAPLDKAFCGDCGQSASTHRYSVKSFLSHDLIHSLWHVDKNIFRTLWEIMVRPGTTARTNIAGARARYFPVVTLLLLLTGIYLFVLHNEFVTEGNQVQIGEWDISDFAIHYQKWIVLSFIPLLALSSWVVFRKSHYNYAEHLIVFIHFFAAVLAWACFTGFLPYNIPIWLNNVINTLWVSYWLLLFWQAFGSAYKSVLGWAWRTVAVGVFFLFICLLIIIGIILLNSSKVKLNI